MSGNKWILQVTDQEARG